MTTRCRLGALKFAALFGASLVLSLVGPLPFAPANAQANCEWYAKTALKQQQDNELLKCGFKGDAWSTDFKAHAVWCESVPPDAWKEQAKKRERELAACAKK